ncbi:MAG: L-seryl-tRNA(Sec) selenium transferase [Lachnospiraceae bacterium]|jgi:L-seryl-tRNA(Ser) seleniumtransferase|nr:L-seryl-tRNA(Sec) selenium transferase [Lachnospiraceae bacterium]
MTKNELFRQIPKVDTLLIRDDVREWIEEYGRDLVMNVIQKSLDEIRERISDFEENESQDNILGENLINEIPERIHDNLVKIKTSNIRRVINATGTILHTNLGRAPIPVAHIQKISEIASGYSNLEYDLNAGRRGERYSHFEELLCKLTGCEAAMAVNNNAAAVMLILNALAKGGEVVVSRGELVEIGGKFRIPDVMEQSGATLKEVGTTNKTHLEDFENAVTQNTKALLKVHTSNYRIVGFTKNVDIEELVPIAKKFEIPLIEDLGSGVLVDLSKYGISYEPTVQESIRKGADVVSFSGDKLLGGPQAGIIVGKKKYIDIMKKNPLTRALRIDKFTAAAIELTLREYLSEEMAVKTIPVLRMITMSHELTNSRANSLAKALNGKIAAEVEVTDTLSQIGGGSFPLERIQGKAVSIKPLEMSVDKAEEALRHQEFPIIARIENDSIIIDVRTVLYDDIASLIRGITTVFAVKRSK